METKHYGLSGIGASVELGNSGLWLHHTVDGLKITSDELGTTLIPIIIGDPLADNQGVTRGYMEKRFAFVVSGEIYDDSGSPGDELFYPVGPFTYGQVYICTQSTGGGTYTEGYLYRYDGAAWVEIIPQADWRIATTEDLTNGTTTFLGDHIYLYDADTSAWVDMGSVISPVSLPKSVALVFGDIGDTDVVFGHKIPVDAVIYRVEVIVTGAFAAPTTILIETDQSDTLAATTESKLSKTAKYIIECYHKVDTVGGEYVQYTLLGASGSGAVTVIVYWSSVDNA